MIVKLVTLLTHLCAHVVANACYDSEISNPADAKWRTGQFISRDGWEVPDSRAGQNRNVA